MLEGLDISSTEVTDISPLSSLTNLRRLEIFPGHITDIWALANLTELRKLSVAAAGVTDLSPLSNLRELRELSLFGSKATDFRPLGNLRKLERLNLNYSAVADISMLSKAIRLEGLYLEGTSVSDISALRYLPELRELNLSGSRVNDISPLSNAIRLRSLDLTATLVSDLRPLAKLRSLRTPTGASFGGLWYLGCPVGDPYLAELSKIGPQGTAETLAYLNALEANGETQRYHGEPHSNIALAQKAFLQSERNGREDDIELILAIRNQLRERTDTLVEILRGTNTPKPYLLRVAKRYLATLDQDYESVSIISLHVLAAGLQYAVEAAYGNQPEAYSDRVRDAAHELLFLQHVLTRQTHEGRFLLEEFGSINRFSLEPLPPITLNEPVLGNRLSSSPRSGAVQSPEAIADKARIIGEYTDQQNIPYLLASGILALCAFVDLAHSYIGGFSLVGSLFLLVTLQFALTRYRVQCGYFATKPDEISELLTFGRQQGLQLDSSRSPP